MEKVKVMVLAFWEKAVRGVDIWQRENQKEGNQSDCPKVSHSLPQ